MHLPIVSIDRFGGICRPSDASQSIHPYVQSSRCENAMYSDGAFHLLQGRHQLRCSNYPQPNSIETYSTNFVFGSSFQGRP